MITFLWKIKKTLYYLYYFISFVVFNCIYPNWLNNNSLINCIVAWSPFLIFIIIIAPYSIVLHNDRFKMCYIYIYTNIVVSAVPLVTLCTGISKNILYSNIILVLTLIFNIILENIIEKKLKQEQFNAFVEYEKIDKISEELDSNNKWKRKEMIYWIIIIFVSAVPLEKRLFFCVLIVLTVLSISIHISFFKFSKLYQLENIYLIP